MCSPALLEYTEHISKSKNVNKILGKFTTFLYSPPALYIVAFQSGAKGRYVCLVQAHKEKSAWKPLLPSWFKN